MHSLRFKAQRLRPVLILATAAVLASTAGAQQTTLESRYYRIHSDLDDAATRDYAKRLDAMYREYQKRLAEFEVKSDTKFEVFLFRRQTDYRKFTGNKLPNSAGIFIPGLRALAGYEESQGRGGLRQTLQHEAFHQFAWQAISPNLPIWLDEGLAQVFEEGVWTGNQFLLGQVPPSRIRDLKADLNAGRFTDFKTFLGLTREQFQARMRNESAGRSMYNQAWAMTHFLVFATDEKDRPRFRTRLMGWLRDMHAGQDAQTAFAGNFSSNVDGFEDRFKEWIATLQPTPLGVYSDRMSKLADLVRLFKDEGRSFDSPDALRAHLSRGIFHLTQLRDGQTYTLDENALTYLCDLSNQPWPADRLKFEQRRGPLPDIVLKSPESATIRIRFYTLGKEIDHDIVFE